MATDGRPGTEKTAFVYEMDDPSFLVRHLPSSPSTSLHLPTCACRYDMDDSSFRGMTVQLGEYHPKDDAVPLDISVEHAYEGAYPRVYLFQRFEHSWHEDVIKFYMMPAAMPLLLAFIDNYNTQVSISSTLIVADIALLFVNVSPTLTFNEQATIFNLIVLVVNTISNYFLEEHEGLRVVDFTGACFSMLGTALLGWYQYRVASQHSDRVSEALTEKNLSAISDLV